MRKRQREGGREEEVEIRRQRETLVDCWMVVRRFWELRYLSFFIQTVPTSSEGMMAW